MKKSRKNMMRASLMMLIVATISLSSATFAWFSTGNSATVANFDITAKSSSGMLVSLDAEDWKSEVEVSKINSTTGGQHGYYVGGTSGNEEIGPVSTAGSIVSRKVGDGENAVTIKTMQFFSGSFDGSKLTSTDVSDTPKGNYYFFNLYFRNDSNSAQKLYLDLTSTVTDNSSNNKATANAVRVGFVVQGSITNDDTSGQEKKTGELARTKYAATSTALIWEPNALAHGEYAVNYRGATNPETSAQEYYGVNTSGQITCGSGNADGIANESGKVTKITTETGSTGTAEIVEMPANAIVKVSVYVWIEGQDIDCNNAESGGKFGVNLSFSSGTASSGN